MVAGIVLTLPVAAGGLAGYMAVARRRRVKLSMALSTAIDKLKKIPQLVANRRRTWFRMRGVSRSGKRIIAGEILTDDDWVAVDNRVAAYVKEFNARYALERSVHYAIAGGCGLFAAMLDLLCVRAPAVPTASWSKGVDGIFNRVVQEAFNHILTPELSKELSRLNPLVVQTRR